MANPFIKRVSDNQVWNFQWLTPNNPHTGQPEIEFIRRPNIDGYAFRRLSQKGEVWSVTAMRDLRNEATARGAAQHLRNEITGELCEITTKDGTTYGRQMCLRVVEREVKVVKATAGTTLSALTDFPVYGSGGLKALVIVEIEFVHAGPPPT